jgi:hypothetical protein
MLDELHEPRVLQRIEEAFVSPRIAATEHSVAAIVIVPQRTGASVGIVAEGKREYFLNPRTY